MQSSMYIAGPVFGLSLAEVQKRFAHGVTLASKAGYQPVSPIEVQPEPHIGDCPPGRPGLDDHSDCCHLRADLKALLECQAILLLQGWQQSWGARLELQVATAAGLRVCFEQFGSGVIWV